MPRYPTLNRKALTSFKDALLYNPNNAKIIEILDGDYQRSEAVARHMVDCTTCTKIYNDAVNSELQRPGSQKYLTANGISIEKIRAVQERLKGLQHDVDKIQSSLDLGQGQS